MLVDFPSRPERARVKHSEAVAAGVTGFQPVRDTEFKKYKERSRQKARYEVLLKRSSSKTSELTDDPIFTHFQEETEKKDGASCVFLLWGSENSEDFKTWAVDVPITDVETYEDEIFKLLKEKYNKELGFLRISHAFQRFRRLKPVTVCPYRLVVCLLVLRLDIVSVDLP